MDSGFTGLCKTWGARWSVGHTALWLIHILLFQWKMHVRLILELLEYYIFPISMCYSLFYSICWRIWEKNWTVSSFVYCSRNLPAMAHPFFCDIFLFVIIFICGQSFFFFFFVLFFFFLAKGSCGSEQCLHCAAERKSKACCCNRHNMKASWKCEAAQPSRSD